MEGDQTNEFDVALEKTPAQEPSPSPELELIFALEEIGVKFSDVPKAVALIERAFESAGDQRGADCLARMAARLEGTASAEALKRVISGDDADPLRDAAERAGCSHVAIFKQEATIRKKLGLTAAPLIGT
jgi:hypothetical protein